MKKTIATLAFLLAGCISAANAQVISNFDSLGGDNYSGDWIAATSISGGVATIGAPALADGFLAFADIQAGTISLSQPLLLSYVARVDAGNLSNSFSVSFADTNGDYTNTSVIVTTGWIVGEFISGTVAIMPTGNGSPSDVAFFTLSGDNTSNAFRMSFDSLTLSAIPEPATYAALAGAVGLGLAMVRRRKVRSV